MNNRIVVTGMGMVSSLGLNIEDTWQKLITAQSGIGYISSFDTTGFGTKIAGEVKGLAPGDFIRDKKELKIMDKHTHMAIASAKMAMDNAFPDDDVSDPYRIGIFMGIGMVDYEIEYVLDAARASLKQNNLWDLRKFGDAYRLIFPLRMLQLLGNMTLCQIAKMYNIQGHNMVLSPFAEAGAQAIGEAVNVLRRGDADIILAGGCSLKVNPASLARFSLLKMLSTNNNHPKKASCPFDMKRDGFVLGEGAGMLVLERLSHALERNARIYAEIIGYGTSCNAYQLSHYFPQNSPQSYSIALSMISAIQDAGLEPADIDYINADAVSNQKGDISETEAIKQVFGHKTEVPVSSTKSMMGHLLGGAGPVELIISILAIRHNIIPPTINYENPDPKCDLDYVPNKSREAKVDVALSNSFGFGGQNVTLVVKKA